MKKLVTFALVLSAGQAFASGPVAPLVLVDEHDPSDTFDRVTVGSTEYVVNNTTRFAAAPTSQRWVATFSFKNPASAVEDQILVVGNGRSVTPVVVESLTPYTAGASFLLGVEFPSINDDGAWAIATVPVDLTPDDNSTPAPEALLQRVLVATPDGLGGFTYSTAVKAGDVLAGVGVFDDPEGAMIRNDGSVAFTDSNFDSEFVGPTDAFFTSPTALALEEAGAAPSGQFPPSDFRPVSSVGEFIVSPGTGDWIIDGTLETGGVFSGPPYNGSATADVIVVNGVVIGQEGQTFSEAGGFAAPGPGDPLVTDFDDPTINASGQYAFIMDLDGVNHAVVYDGSGFTVVAAEGGPVLPGSTELWTGLQDVYLADDGTYVVTGNTDGDGLTNNVAVANNRFVIAREGDALDFDGDGTPDGYLDGDLNADETIFGDGSAFVIRTDIKDAFDGSTMTPNDSFFMVATHPADWDIDGTVNVNDLLGFLGAFRNGAGDFDRNGATNVNDLLGFLGAFRQM